MAWRRRGAFTSGRCDSVNGMSRSIVFRHRPLESRPTGYMNTGWVSSQIPSVRNPGRGAIGGHAASGAPNTEKLDEAAGQSKPRKVISAAVIGAHWSRPCGNGPDSTVSSTPTGRARPSCRSSKTAAQGPCLRCAQEDERCREPIRHGRQIPEPRKKGTRSGTGLAECR